MRVETIISIVFLYVLAAIGLSFCFWGDLDVENYPPSATIRNLVLIGGTPLAIFLAVWRSVVAQKQVETAQRQAETAQRQAEIAQRGLTSNRYQRAVEMLGNNLVSVRLGGIYTLYKIVREHPDEYLAEVQRLLDAYKRNPNRMNTREEMDELEGIILSIRRLDEEIHS